MAYDAFVASPLALFLFLLCRNLSSLTSHLAKFATLHLLPDRFDTKLYEQSNIKASTMSPPQDSVSEGGKFTQNDLSANDNLTLATTCANISLRNAVRLKDPPTHRGPVYEQHVFNLLIAYNEIDILAKSVGVSPEVAAHAKSLYSQVYNFSDFEENRFQHDTLIAGCHYIACCEKNQDRTMPDVFKSSRAETKQMLSVYETLKAFFAVPVETRSLLSEGDKRLQSAYEEIRRLSVSLSIPPYASQYINRLYKMTHDSGSFRDQDQKLIMVTWLLIACRQLGIPRSFQAILAIDPGVTKDRLGRTFKTLEVFLSAGSKQKTTETSQIRDDARGTIADVRSNDRIIHTLQELTEQLNLETDPPPIERRNAVVEASFAPSTHISLHDCHRGR